MNEWSLVSNPLEPRPLTNSTLSKTYPCIICTYTGYFINIDLCILSLERLSYYRQCIQQRCPYNANICRWNSNGLTLIYLTYLCVYCCLLIGILHSLTRKFLKGYCKIDTGHFFLISSIHFTCCWLFSFKKDSTNFQRHLWICPYEVTCKYIRQKHCTISVSSPY